MVAVRRCKMGLPQETQDELAARWHKRQIAVGRCQIILQSGQPCGREMQDNRAVGSSCNREMHDNLVSREMQDNLLGRCKIRLVMVICCDCLSKCVAACLRLWMLIVNGVCI